MRFALLLLVVPLSALAQVQSVSITEKTGSVNVTTTTTGTKALKVDCVQGCGASTPGLTNTELRATPVPVSGTFYQATQPVSIATMPATPVTDNGGSLTVDGTFWQATQPVSGTFWQATQPVSGPLTDTQLRATAVPVSGTVSVNALPVGTNNIGDVDVLTLPALVAGTANIGDVDVLTLPGITTSGATAPTSALLAGGRATADAASPTNRTAGQLADLVATTEGRLLVETSHPRRVNCSILSTATTLADVTGCGAPGAGLSLYITDIHFSSSAAGGVAADAHPTLKYGTGANCVTAPTTFWRSMVIANDAVIQNNTTPIKIPANNAVCLMMSTAGTKAVNLQGYIAP